MNAPPRPAFIFKILRGREAASLVQDLVFLGSFDDRAAGFVHLCTAAQAPGTAAKHFAGESGLWLAALDAARLGPELRWEPSRHGEVFPHLHGPLRAEHVAWLTPLPLGSDGLHRFPAELA